MKSSLGNIGYYTSNFLNDYAKKISSCQDIEEYFNLITSIYIFQTLVFNHLKKEFENENIPKEEAEQFISLIKQKADELADYFDKTLDKKEIKPKHKLNIN